MTLNWWRCLDLNDTKYSVGPVAMQGYIYFYKSMPPRRMRISRQIPIKFHFLTESAAVDSTGLTICIASTLVDQTLPIACATVAGSK